MNDGHFSSPAFHCQFNYLLGFSTFYCLFLFFHNKFMCLIVSINLFIFSIKIKIIHKMTTHFYTVFEQQQHQHERYDVMPEENISRLSGGIGCGGGSSTRGTHFFRHDPLEEELDPCLSAAVRYQKEKRSGFIKLRYFLCCLIVILAIALIAFALFPIFGSNHQMKNEKQRISTVNGSGGNEWAVGSSQMEMEEATIGNGGRTDEEQTKPTEQTEEEVRLRAGRPRPTTTTTTTIRQVPPRRPKPTTTTRPTITTTTQTQPPRRITTTTTTKKPSILLMPKSAHRRIRDCDYHHKIGHKSGAHKLSVDDYEFYAYCQMDSNHGWTTLQRRTSDKVPFWNATFNEYADGFGQIPDGDHWLGLESLWALADNRKMEMQIQIEGDVCKKRACRDGGEVDNWWGIWEFTIGSREDAYRISNLKFVRGNLSDETDPTNADMFSFLSNDERFTTVDVDNDQNKMENCAFQKQRGGWWHRDCSYTTLNGEYAKAGSKSSGFYWLWKSAKESAAVPTYQIKPRKSTMLFRIAE